MFRYNKLQVQVQKVFKIIKQVKKTKEGTKYFIEDNVIYKKDCKRDYYCSVCELNIDKFKNVPCYDPSFFGKTVFLKNRF